MSLAKKMMQQTLTQNKSNHNIDIDKGTAAAIKRTTLLPTKEQSTGRFEIRWSNATKSICKPQRGALEFSISNLQWIAANTPTKKDRTKYTASVHINVNHILND